MTPFNIGRLTMREWIDIQADIYAMDKAGKEAERRARRRG